MLPIENDYETKCLCILVIDTSGSMNANNVIAELNDSLNRFKEVIMQDCVTKSMLELGIITFDSDVKMIQQPDKLTNIEIPRLRAQGFSLLVPAIEEAQKLVEKREEHYKIRGIPYYRPRIIVITDGAHLDKGQDIARIASKIKSDVVNQYYCFDLIDIGDMQNSVLSTFETKEMSILRMPINKIKFEELFALSKLQIEADFEPTPYPYDQSYLECSSNWMDIFTLENI